MKQTFKNCIVIGNSPELKPTKDYQLLVDIPGLKTDRVMKPKEYEELVNIINFTAQDSFLNAEQVMKARLNFPVERFSMEAQNEFKQLNDDKP